MLDMLLIVEAEERKIATLAQTHTLTNSNSSYRAKELTLAQHKKENYSKSQMYSGSFRGAVLLDKAMLLFSIDNDSLCVLLNSIIP